MGPQSICCVVSKIKQDFFQHLVLIRVVIYEKDRFRQTNGQWTIFVFLRSDICCIDYVNKLNLYALLGFFQSLVCRKWWLKFGEENSLSLMPLNS